MDKGVIIKKMPVRKRRKGFKVSCVVPAYNEERTIANLLRFLTASFLIDEVIVVDDGSSDNTVSIVRKNFPQVKLVSHSDNRGKADALITGAKRAINPVLFFCGADLRGLNKKHLQRLIMPVINGEVRMVVGVQEYMNVLREKKWYRAIAGSFSMSNFIKKLGGEKVLFKKDFLAVAGIQGSNYGVEQRLVDYFERNNLPFKYFLMKGVGHIHKFQKWGLKEGLPREVRAIIGFCTYSLKRRLEELFSPGRS